MLTIGACAIKNIVVVAAILAVSGCIDGPRMLTKSDRVPALEKGKWCKFDASKRGLIDKCYAFKWRDGYYHDNERRYGFKDVGDGKFIGEYVELDEATGDPKFKFWPKFVVQMDVPNSRMANIGFEESHFEDFERRATYYADARDATLSLDIDNDLGLDTWYIQGAPYAIRRVLTDIVDHLKPSNPRYYNIIDDENMAAANSYQMQIARIVDGTELEDRIAGTMCAAGVVRGRKQDRTAADTQFVKDTLSACAALRSLDLEEGSTLAILLSDDGNIEEADAYYKMATDYPYHVDDRQLRDDVFYNWALMYFQARNYEKAIHTFTQLLNENPKHLVARNTRGLTHRLLNNHPKALTDYSETIKIAKELKDDLQLGIALMRRGYVHQDDGRLDVGEKDVKAALALLPELSYGHSTLGVIAEKRGQPLIAKKHFEKALAIDAGNAHAKEGMARIN